jgi:hypothetical protein
MNKYIVEVNEHMPMRTDSFRHMFYDGIRPGHTKEYIEVYADSEEEMKKKVCKFYTKIKHEGDISIIDWQIEKKI